MKFIGKLLRDRNFILLLAIVLGLSLGKSVAAKTVPLVIPLLILVMTLSATDVKSRELITAKNLPAMVGFSLMLNYLVMGGITLLLSWWLIKDTVLWTGFAVFALVPPAVGVVPLSNMLGGNTRFSLIGLTAAYLSALVIMPVAMTFILGIEDFDILQILLMVGELVLLPIVFSRILLAIKPFQRIKPWQGTITNWSFFITIFTIVGLNRDAFFGDLDTLIRIIIIAVAVSFLLGFILDIGTRLLRIDRQTKISMILMGTTKNYSLASGILLALFDERAALPSSVCAVFGILHFVWLGFRFRKKT
jgi:BASS family bile acid:Na+ symporter